MRCFSAKRWQPSSAQVRACSVPPGYPSSGVVSVVSDSFSGNSWRNKMIGENSSHMGIQKSHGRRAAMRLRTRRPAMMLGYVSFWKPLIFRRTERRLLNVGNGSSAALIVVVARFLRRKLNQQITIETTPNGIARPNNSGPQRVPVRTTRPKKQANEMAATIWPACQLRHALTP